MKKVIRATARSLSKNLYRVNPPSAKKEFQDLMNGGDTPEPEPPITTGYTFESITLPDECEEGQEVFFPEGYTTGQTIAAEDIHTYITAIAELAAETLSEKDAKELFVECSGTLPVEGSYISASKEDTAFFMEGHIYPDII